MNQIVVVLNQIVVVLNQIVTVMNQIIIIVVIRIHKNLLRDRLDNIIIIIRNYIFNLVINLVINPVINLIFIINLIVAVPLLFPGIHDRLNIFFFHILGKFSAFKLIKCFFHVFNT